MGFVAIGAAVALASEGSASICWAADAEPACAVDGTSCNEGTNSATLPPITGNTIVKVQGCVNTTEGAWHSPVATFQYALAVDTDGDGVYDHEEERDTDNDGIPDYLESSVEDLDDDGVYDHEDPDDDGDGIPTAQESGDFAYACTFLGGSCNVTAASQDIDNDGTPDYRDEDDDNDGI